MIQNIAASIRQRLLNKAKKESRPFHELLQYYVMERFLYRLSQSQHTNDFILKGALMLHVWQAPDVRATRDIDFLGKRGNQVEIVTQQIKNILAVGIKPDGLIFDANIRTETITEEADYCGVRAYILAYLETARIHLQIDIGFGDIVFPPPEIHALPSLLNLPRPRLWCYSRESVVAEKLEAMYTLGELNSRMKDFYDIWFLMRQYTFDTAALSKAIQLTFSKRKTVLSSEGCIFFSPMFATSKQSQWRAFKHRLGLKYIPDDFEHIIAELKMFLLPIIERIQQSNLTLAQKEWINCYCPIEDISDIAGDAGFRHYYRIHSADTSYIFVDASLEPPIFQAYLQQTRYLSAYGLPIPALIAVEEKQSWALLEDLGETLLIDHPERERFYPQAMDHLIAFHACPIQAYGRFKALDATLIDEEFQGFQQWYLRDLMKYILNPQEQQALEVCLSIIKETVLAQPIVFMHRDYHSRNLLCKDDRLGIIDFQDAMAGPITYDLASLLRDCYIDWPAAFSEKMALYYKRQSPLLRSVSDEQFLRWFDFTSIQRHLKALFTFARKALRDNQPEYLAHVPRTWSYIQQVSEKYPSLGFLSQLSKSNIIFP